MQSNNKKPLVSVVVPVHNCGKYLRDTLDTLVFQTLEDIEIIVIENGSSDNTYEIMQEYAEKYPSKVFIHQIPPVNTSAEGRSLGFKLARADYVYSCDGDDLVDYRALEKLYNFAISGDYEIVGGRDCSYRGTEKKTSKRILSNPTTERYIFDQTPAFWSRLVKKSLLEYMGDIPIDIPLSDVAYILPLSTFTKKIGFVNYPPIYHYFRRNGSEVNSYVGKNELDIISATHFALDTSNPAYREEILYHLAIRLFREYDGRWMYRDQIVQRVKELWAELEKNKYLLKYKKAYERLSELANLPELTKQIIYLNGFAKPSDDLATFISSNVPVFWNEVEFNFLDETNCDIHENSYIEQCYKNGKFEDVAVYFALQKIKETGGFYLNRNIRIDVPLNSLRLCKTVFGYIDSSSFSDWFWGAQPYSEIIEDLLATYNNNSIYNQKQLSLAKRIKNILWMKYDVQPNGLTIWNNTGITVLGPECVVCHPYPSDSLYLPLHFCTHLKYTFENSDEIVCISRKTLQTIVNNANHTLNITISKLKKSQKAYEKLQNSNVYKVLIHLKRITNGPMGPFLKKIFHAALRVRAKLLHYKHK